MNLHRLCALALVLAATNAAAAEKARRAKPETAKADPCASHGPGFMLLPGTTTCVRIGGAAVGDFSAGRGSAPNLGLK